MNNKKGFTMVELLGAVVILGILMLVAIPSVTRYIGNSKDNYYKTQKKQLVIATKSYLSNSKITIQEGDSIDVAMDELVDNKYITAVQDANKGTCVGTKPDSTGLTGDEKVNKENEYTYVRVKRKNSKLEYTVHLWCENNKEGKLDDSDVAPIDFDLVATNTNGKRIVTINIKMKDNSAKLASYSYNIFKRDINLVKKNGTTNGKQFVIRQDVSRLVDNDSTVLKVYLRAVDSKGRVFNCTKEVAQQKSSGEPMCPATTIETQFIKEKNVFNYSFLCTSLNGCTSDVYHGTINITASNSKKNQEFALEDKVEPTLTGKCTITLPEFYSPPPTETPEPEQSEKNTKGETTSLKPAKPVITNNHANKWVKFDYGVSVKTSTKAADIGRWYYTYDTKNGKDKIYELKTLNGGAKSSVGKNNYTTMKFQFAGDRYVYVKVCSKYAKSSVDTKNCSSYAKTRMKRDKTAPDFKTTSQRVKNGNNEWMLYFQDTQSGLSRAKDGVYFKTGDSIVRYCYANCSRACVKYKHGSNIHPMVTKQGKKLGYYLRTAYIAENFKNGTTKKDRLLMQTSRACNGGRYTLHAEVYACDMAGNCQWHYAKFKF